MSHLWALSHKLITPVSFSLQLCGSWMWSLEVEVSSGNDEHNVSSQSLIIRKKNTGIPHFSKDRFTPCHFYKRCILIHVFTNRKKFKDDFHFYKKSWKVKIMFSVGFAASHSRGNTHPEQWERHQQVPSLGSILSVLASNLHSLELCLWASALYLNLFCASISEVCHKVIASLLYTISV